jgi:hypothetical protein
MSLRKCEIKRKRKEEKNIGGGGRYFFFGQMYRIVKTLYKR